MRSFLALSISMFLACARPAAAPAPGEVSAEDAKQNAVAAVRETRAGKTWQENDANEHVWIVELQLVNGGAVIVAEVERGTGTVTELGSEHGPFDYDFEPTGGLIGFAKAKNKALEAKAGQIQQWELDRAKKQYEYVVQDAHAQLFDVIVDAEHGQLKGVTDRKAK